MGRPITLHLLESYFRHKWLNLVPILVMMIAAGIYLIVMKTDYMAQGVLYINNQSLLSTAANLQDPNTNYWVTPAQTTANEINELINTDAFARAIVKQTDLEKQMSEGPANISEVFTYVRKQIRVTTLGNNQTQIKATDPDPILAYQLVNSLIENYIQWKMNSKKAETQAGLDFFLSLDTKYKSDFDNARKDLETYVSENPAPIQGDRPFLEQFEISRLNDQIKIAQDRYVSVLEKEENTKLALSQIESSTKQTYVLMDAPEIPVRSKTSLKTIGKSLAIFLLSGVFLSILLVIGSYLLDRTVRFSIDVTTQLNLPVLAVIPDTTLREPSLSALPKWDLLKSRSFISKELESQKDNNDPEDNHKISKTTI